MNTEHQSSPLNLSTMPPLALLSPEVTAQALGLKTNTLACWRSTGRTNLRFIRVGRLIRYRVQDILEYLESQSATHTGEFRSPTKQ
jgi:hypothetical protein